MARKSGTDDPIHAYVIEPHSSRAGETIKARQRLYMAWPRPTLLHLHAAGRVPCKGQIHIIFRLDGTEQESIGVDPNGH